MTAETLTPAEIEMIRIKREQSALAKKEALLKKQAETQKDIVDKTKYINEQIAKGKSQVAAAKALADELGKGFELVINQHPDHSKVYGEYLNPENPKASNWEREVVWSQNWIRESACIKFKDYTISIEEQIVYSSRWDVRGTSKGYKMYVSGPGIEWKDERKALSRVSTVKEKIQSAIDERKAEEDRKNSQKSAVQKTVDRMKSEYPGATVSAGTDCEKLGKGYIHYPVVFIKLENKIEVTYRVYPDGSLSRKKVSFPSEAKQWDLLKVLSGMKF